MKYLLAGIRMILCIICIFFFFLLLIIASVFLGKNIQRAFTIRKACVKGLIKILGYKIKTIGQIDQINPAVYISNHRCFSDPILALKYYTFYPVGKAEVEKYPLIGIAAKESGVLFVQRDKKESRNNVKEAIRKTLLEGLSIFLCPEGTTHVGQITKQFKLGAFDIAAKLRVPVIPLAMVYSNPAADFWIPTDSLLQHFIRQFGKWETRIDIYFPDQPFTHTDPVILMNNCKNWIDEKLLLVKVPDRITALENLV